MKNSTTKFLTIAVILLLLANIALVVFMFFGKENKGSKHQGGKAGFDKMVKEIGMSDVQKKEYDSMREAHFSTIRPLFDSIRIIRQSLFKLIKEDSVNEDIINTYTNNISEKQTLADRLTLNHFRKVRKMFDSEQQKKYDDFVQKMMNRDRGKKDSTDKKK